MKTWINCLMVAAGVIAFVGSGVWLNHRLTKRAHEKELQNISTQNEMKKFEEEFKKVKFEALKKVILKSIPSPSQKLSKAELQKRTKNLNAAQQKYPKAHEIYALKCLSCHGKIAEGKETISNFSTRMQHRAAPYQTPPLLKDQKWRSSFAQFTKDASKKDKPHLPSTGLEALDESALQNLHTYLSELVQP